MINQGPANGGNNTLILNAKSRGLYDGLQWFWKSCGTFSDVRFESFVSAKNGNETVQLSGNHASTAAAMASLRWCTQNWAGPTTPSLYLFTDIERSELRKLQDKGESFIEGFVSKRRNGAQTRVFLPPRNNMRDCLRMRGHHATTAATSDELLCECGVQTSSGARWCVRSVDKGAYPQSLTAERAQLQVQFPRVHIFIPPKPDACALTVSGPCADVRAVLAKYNIEPAETPGIPIKSKPGPAKETDLKEWEARLTAWEARLTQKEQALDERSLLTKLRIGGVETNDVGTMTSARPAGGDAVATADEMPPKCDWTEHCDKNSKRTFYYNNSTKKSQWNKPDEFLALEAWKAKQEQKKEAAEAAAKAEAEAKAAEEAAAAAAAAAAAEAAAAARAAEAAALEATKKAAAMAPIAAPVAATTAPPAAAGLPVHSSIPPTALPRQGAKAGLLPAMAEQLEGVLFAGAGSGSNDAGEQAASSAVAALIDPSIAFSAPLAENTDSVNAFLNSFVQKPVQEEKKEVSVFELFKLSGANPASTPPVQPHQGTSVPPTAQHPSTAPPAARVPPTAVKAGKACSPEIQQFLESSGISHLQHLFVDVPSPEHLLALSFAQLQKLIADDGQRLQIVEAVQVYRERQQMPEFQRASQQHKGEAANNGRGPRQGMEAFQKKMMMQQAQLFGSTPTPPQPPQQPQPSAAPLNIPKSQLQPPTVAAAQAQAPATVPVAVVQAPSNPPQSQYFTLQQLQLAPTQPKPPQAQPQAQAQPQVQAKPFHQKPQPPQQPQQGLSQPLQQLMQKASSNASNSPTNSNGGHQQHGRGQGGHHNWHGNNHGNGHNSHGNQHGHGGAPQFQLKKAPQKPQPVQPQQQLLKSKEGVTVTGGSDGIDLKRWMSGM